MQFADTKADRFSCIKLIQGTNKGGNYERFIKRWISRFWRVEIGWWFDFNDSDFFVDFLASRKILTVKWLNNKKVKKSFDIIQ
jgi:hypothetical protein